MSNNDTHMKYSTKIFIVPLLISLYSINLNASVAFSLIDDSFNEAKDKYVLENLPKSFSQDTFSNCNAVAAAFILDATNCRKDPKKRRCDKWPDEEAFSRLDITRYNQEAPKQGKYRDYFRGVQGPGSAKNIVYNAFNYRVPVASQKCSSLDQVLAKFGDTPELRKAQQAAWNTLKRKYEDYQAKKNCPTCTADFFAAARTEISEHFKIQKDNTELLTAFSQQTYEMFLDKLLIPAECSKDDNMVSLDNVPLLKLDAFPRDELEITTYEKSIDTIKSVLSKQVPILVDNVCTGNNFNLKKTQDANIALIRSGINARTTGAKGGQTSKEICSDAHSVVISGYRKICKKIDTPEEECRESLKIENTWGKTWQNENNDGWVDAQTFMDRTGYLGQNLIWIEDKPKDEKKSTR